jgi:hypothetical protein
VITGSGFCNVTAPLPILVVSCALVAVTVTLVGVGKLLGAVYKPVALTVPSVALPPAVPFTDQVTFVFVLPVTVAVNACVAPARKVALAGATTTERLLDGPVTVSFTATDAINPGFGFCTVRFTLPICADVAVPVAVTCVAEVRVVVSAVLPNISVAPGAKFVPFTVSVKATPLVTEVGVTEVMAGVGLLSVTTLLPVAVALPDSAALTETVFELGGNCGAV